MAGQVDHSMLLIDIPVSHVQTLGKIIDSGVGTLGWKGLAARISPSWVDVRLMETREAAGKSPTQELLWSWAQQNKTVGDLLRVLEDMGHQRALSLFQSPGVPQSLPMPPPPPPHTQKAEPVKPECCSERLSCDSSSTVTEGNNEARLKVTFPDVVEGTGNFHEENKIGGGHFSDVYRGMKGSQAFAVKVFKQVQNGSWKSLWEKFRTEMEVLHLYQHPNILELYGCFSDGDRYFLVYPYLPNGSLHSRLHTQDSGKVLLWQERLEVIKGTAKAIHHLHSTQPCAVICANISSANILLDNRLQPKLSDFGMARLRPHSGNQSCTITMRTSNHGNCYLPVEYNRGGKLSVKVDIYSFGMVVLETVTGEPVKPDKTTHTPLRAMLDDVAEEGGGVDACLRLSDSRAGSWPHAVALSLLRLGMDCSASKPSNRPSMEMVLQTLSQLLPLPYPPEDQPRTLDDGSGGTPPKKSSPTSSPPSHCLSASLPVEDDEETSMGCGVLPRERESAHWYPSNAVVSVAVSASADSGPCECSQSEVIFVGGAGRDAAASALPRQPHQHQHHQHQPWQQQHNGGRKDTYATTAKCVSDSQQLQSAYVSSSAHTLQSDCASVGELDAEPYAELDLYGSWPVQCSCAPDTDAQECEDCRNNALSPLNNTPFPSHLTSGGPSESYLENSAKQRLRHKIQQYNQGLMCTDELLSITP
ncbi:interleukin-1 receptor-associated kinase 3 [Engraulis encrasicolus]|uniref:interleukin-1 receptor-associated kinase 3 n=1 Tax=Engraulis encrasicolus TaxID=184585 RepID=UPI002FD5BEF9